MLRRGCAVIFHRHGHRAPARPIQESPFLEDETKLWTELTSASDQHKSLGTRFPISNSNSALPRDLNTAPYGQITLRGLSTLENIGKTIAHDFPHLAAASTNQYEVYATNYQRTQASAQQLLTGLLASTKGVPITVRPTSQCAMSFYEGNPILSTALLQMSQTSSRAFGEREESDEIQQLKKQLLYALPGLSMNGQFDWMAAFDYFVCREAHELPTLPTISKLSFPVKQHLSFRYNHYYANPHHLAHIAVPLLIDLRNAIMKSTMATSQAGGGAAVLPMTVTVFSGHDVSILALLHAFHADVLTTPAFWPDYGSSLIFDVHVPSDCSTLPSKKDVVIEVFYQLRPLSVHLSATSTDHSHEANSTHNVKKPKLFTLEDLDRCIDTMRQSFIT